MTKTKQVPEWALRAAETTAEKVRNMYYSANEDSGVSVPAGLAAELAAIIAAEAPDVEELVEAASDLFNPEVTGAYGSPAWKGGMQRLASALSKFGRGE